MDQSDASNYLNTETEFFRAIGGHFDRSVATYTEKMHAFARWVPRQDLAYFLVRHQVFKKIVERHGMVLDFGVHHGSSFFTFLQLSAMLEPYNHTRRVVGFDSFQGFTKVAEEDRSPHKVVPLKSEGSMSIFNGEEEIRLSLSLYDQNRPLGHIPRGEFVSGVLAGSLESWMQDHQEATVALANFGLGLYQPTKEILQILRPRLQSGSVLMFEEIGQDAWPGETRALYEVFQPHEIELHRSPLCPQLSWMEVRSNQ